MALSYTQLIRFDLLSGLEERLLSNAKQVGKFFEFQTIAQKIDVADQFIKELPSFPHSNKNIIRDELVSAIGSTLAIEGIAVDNEKIKETLDGGADLQVEMQRKRQEVVNSRIVYDYIIHDIDGSGGKFAYSLEGINCVHEHFTSGIDYPGNSPGRYRNTGATFGDPRKPSLCRNYTEVYQAMTLFVEWLNSTSTGPLTGNKIAKAIMAHYYFTEIHAFGDGNGRTARAIEAMVLYKHNINPYCFWSLANFWSAHRGEYLAHLDSLRRSCDPFDFIKWGTEGYLGEVLRIKGLVLQKVKQLMLKDYVAWLVNTSKGKAPEKKVNQRMACIVFMLGEIGRQPLAKFRQSAQYQALYAGKSPMTKSRDFNRLKTTELIKLTTVDAEEFVEPNYDIFNKVRYTT